MLAFCGTESKADTIARMQMHANADELVQGSYWEWEQGQGKGCAVGCMTYSNGHDEYPKRWGIPQELAYLEDSIFEGLENEEAKAWPIQFLEAIPVGADLSMVWPRFVLACLSDKDSPIQIGLGKDEITDKAVTKVAALYGEWVASIKLIKDRWKLIEGECLQSLELIGSMANPHLANCVDWALSMENYVSPRWFAWSIAHVADYEMAMSGGGNLTKGQMQPAWRWMRNLLLRLSEEAPVSRMFAKESYMAMLEN